MGKIKEHLSVPAKATAYAAIAILFIVSFSLSFWLMNQPNTLAFIVGILCFVFTLILLINSIYIKIKNKLKS